MPHLTRLGRQTAWGLMALSAHTGYKVPPESMLQFTIEICEKVENVTCSEYAK